MIKQRIFAFISLGLLVAVLIITVDRIRFLSRAVHAEGTVTSITAANSSCGGGKRRRSYPCTKFRAQVNFYDLQGGVHSTSISAGSVRGSGQSTESSSFHNGQAVQLAYDPNDPSRVFQDTFFDIWGLPLLLELIQIITLVVSFFEPGRRRYGRF